VVLNWLEDNALHLVAYLALRFRSPLGAKAWVERVASVCHRPIDAEGAKRLSRRLGTRGTCLSRSLAIAARCPGSVLVIGAKKRETVVAAPSIQAHAWVEVDGSRLEPEGGGWIELVRLT
jgi:hypothetical protein